MRVALYPRVSTQEQALNGNSMDEQIKRMEKFCEAMGWEAYQIYADAGHSGANMDRPALKQMIKDVKAGKIDKVLVYKLDRLSRSQKDTLELIEDIFLANNVDFVSMSENFDTSTAFGRAMIGILAVFAQLEREQIKERMMMGKIARAKKGKYYGGYLVPIGYEYIDGDLKVNPFEAAQIVQIFDMYIAGKSPQTIANELNEAGYYHKNGKWEGNTVRYVLDRKYSIGYISYAGQWFKGTHDPIISEETYLQAQNVRLKRREEYTENNRRQGKAASYLTGYMECACCHARYVKVARHRTIKGKTYEYRTYQCASRAKKSKGMIKDPNCKNANWNIDKLDNLIFGEIRKLATDPEYITVIKETAPKDERAEAIKAEIANLEEQHERVMDLYTIGKMPMAKLQDRLSDISDKQIALEHELEKIESEQNEKLTHDQTMEIVSQFGDILDRGDFDEIRAAIGSLIKKIVIDGENIDIYWTFA